MIALVHAATQEPDEVAVFSNTPLWRWLHRRSASAPQEGIASGQVSGNDASPRRLVIAGNENCCGISDVGLVRPGNEDAFLIVPEQGLLVVADGLGGHAAGEVAAALAISHIREVVVGCGEEDDPAAVLERAFVEADGLVRAHAAANPDCEGMGATLIAALIRGDELFVAHVGDVRAYRWHDGNLARLTQDHTAVGRLLEAGLIDEDAARRHPARNLVEQAIGGSHAAVPEHVRLALAPGDRILLCSDGLWDEVQHADMAAILADATPALHLATRLVDKAIIGGGNDNITAVVYRHAGDHADI